MPPRKIYSPDGFISTIFETMRADLVAGILQHTRLGPPHWSTSQHLCSTAAMGRVVDPHCRVYGVAGLQVIDGSVLPRVPSRGPHATIAMLAHRAAEFV